MSRLPLKLTAAAAAALLALAAAGSTGAAGARPHGKQQGGKVVFISSQLNTVPESEAFRNVILKGYSGEVDFVNTTAENVAGRVRAEAQAGNGSISLVGDVEGNFAFYRDALSNLTPVANTLGAQRIPAPLRNLGKLDTSRQLFIPWMQATYIMTAHKSALRYLPKGAKLNNLSYGDLYGWARNMSRALGRPALGFPVGPTGLMLRYLHGYLLPSFSGGVLSTFTSQNAAGAWRYLRSLWPYVHRQSLQYNIMSEPLLNGEVLVAWDHVARLANALRARPNDFVTFPSPRGKKGRGYLPVVAGVAIPKTSPNPAGARAAIRYLLGLNSQARTLGAVGFFPVVQGRLSKQLGSGLLKMVATVRQLQGGQNSIVGALPVGLGVQGANFNRVFIETFTRIVTRGENPSSVLPAQARRLQEIMNAVSAPCFRPDPPSRGTCQVR